MGLSPDRMVGDFQSFDFSKYNTSLLATINFPSPLVIPYLPKLLYAKLGRW